MKPQFIFVTLLLMLLTVFLGAGTAAQPETQTAPDKLTAEALLQKVDEEMVFYKDRSVTTTVIVIDKDGTEKVREMKVWEKGNKRLVRFVKPASERGMSLLAADKETNYVYLPSYKRVRRVAAHARNQTFMGTDMTQTDMSLIRFADDYVPKLIGETDTCWELELNPKPGKDVGYGKLLVQATKDRFSVAQVSYFGKDGRKIKTEQRKEWAMYEGGHYMASTVQVTNAAGDHQTILRNNDYKVNQGIPDSFFSQRNLKKPIQ